MDCDHANIEGDVANYCDLHDAVKPCGDFKDRVDHPRRIEFKTRKPGLTNLEMKMLYEEGPELFSRLDWTPNARKWIAEHPKLQKVFDNW